MECLIIKKNSDKDSYLDLSSDVFDVKYNEILLHQFIVSFIGNSHQRSKKQKSRGMVRGGGRKPWKQKGSGRARVGSIRSPLWKGGGKIFAATVLSSLNRKINKKIYKLAMKIIFSELFRNNRLKLIDSLILSEVKTKNFLNEISFLGITSPVLFIVEDLYMSLYLSSRNVKNIFVCSCKNLDPLLLLKFKNIFVTISAIKFIEEKFK